MIGLVGKGPKRELVVPKRLRRERLATLRGAFDKGSKILEIGPLFRPVAAKRDGYNVFIVDKFSREDLEENYKYIVKRTAEIEEVDFVWGDSTLDEAVPVEHHGTFDVIIMSHVLEHSPDPLALLRSCSTLIKTGGIVSLALPDKRHCFDALRPVTTTGAWLEAHETRATVHTRQTLFEYASTSVARNKRITWWDDAVFSVNSMTFTTRSLEDAYTEFYRSGPIHEYQDCHAWVFTPASFALIAHEAHALELSPLVPTMVTTTFQGEFFVHLSLIEGSPIDHRDRLQLMALSATEQAQGYRMILPSGRRIFSAHWFRYVLSPLSLPKIRAMFP